MLLYEYPEKTDRLTAQLKQFDMSAQSKKIKRNSIINIVLGIVILVFALMIDTVWVKLLAVAAALFSIYSACMIYFGSKKFSDGKFSLKVYEDRLIYEESSWDNRKLFKAEIFYSDILSSGQNATGGLVINLKDGYSSEFTVKSKDQVKKVDLKQNCAVLYFSNIKPKMFLINEMYDKIKYPKKNYNVITDDDEDDWK